jgi:hypothetical protein
MNLNTILMCAQMTARQQIAALGYVDADVQALIDEVESLLAPDAVVEDAPAAEKTAPVAKKTTAKK